MSTYDQELDATPYQSLNDDSDKLKKITSSVSKWYDYFSNNNSMWLEDSNFALGRQWTSQEKASYSSKNKVLLTINVLYSYILNIVGEQRQNSPQIEVRAKSLNIPQNTINLMEGILREISYSSDANLAYQIAFTNALMGGYGAWRIVVDYENSKTFDKIIKLAPSLDPLKHYFDPDATHPTKYDGNFAGTYSRMSREEFSIMYPDIEAPASIVVPNASGFYWNDRDSVLIGEDFRKIFKKTKLYKLSNNMCVYKEDLDDTIKMLKNRRDQFESKIMGIYSGLIMHGLNPPPPPSVEDVKIIDERDTERVMVKQTKYMKDVILDETDWYGEDLPIIFVDGDSHNCNGIQEIRSFIEYSKDSQRFLNFCISEISQSLKTSNKTQFMFTPDNIKGFEQVWRNPERSISGLPFNPDPRMQGQAPIKLNPPEVSNSLFNATQNMVSMIDNTLGRYEANKGQQGNEQSGVAVANRAKQGNKSVFVFIDNLNKAIEQTNKICLNIIPEVYGDNEKIVYTVNKEGKRSAQEINTSDETKLKNDTMSVFVTIGPSFEMQKVDAFNQLLQFISLNPQQFSTLLADLVAGNLNVDNTNQIVERLKNFVVPPAVTAKEEGKQPPPPPPNPQLELAQMQTKADMLRAIADVEKATNDIKTTQAKSDAEIEKAQISLASDIVKAYGDIRSQQIQSDMAINEANINSLSNMLSQTSQFITNTLQTS